MRRLLVAALMLGPTLAAADATYAYQPGLHRDPFSKPEELKPATPPTTCTNGPLCAVNLSEVKVTAVVTGTARPLAMIEDAKGEYMIREGMPIGPNGVVAHIREGGVVVREVIYSASAPRSVERTLAVNVEQ